MGIIARADQCPPPAPTLHKIKPVGILSAVMPLTLKEQDLSPKANAKAFIRSAKIHAY